MYDFIVIGAGLAGGVIARKLAEDNKKVLIVERRNHIAGNIYDYMDQHGIKIQKYGPHVLHTNIESVYKFITRFCEPVNYRTKCEAVIDGISTPSPFNFTTIDQFYEVAQADDLKRRLLNNYKNRSSVTVVELLEAEDEVIRDYANFLFEKDYRPYTAKQWNLEPEKIDVSVLKRVPVLLSYNDNYFEDRYEFIPKEGFSGMYSQMVNHPNITIICEVNALDHISFMDDRILYDGEVVNIIYTGAIDELFKYRFGVLPYRSLNFDFLNVERSSFQNVAIVAYPQEPGYTRITEYTKMPFQESDGWTSIAYEYPIEYDNMSSSGNEPYYPILTEESVALYSRYDVFSKRFKNLFLCGRLADYKYYNMDQVIDKAFEVYEKISEVYRYDSKVGV